MKQHVWKKSCDWKSREILKENSWWNIWQLMRSPGNRLGRKSLSLSPVHCYISERFRESNSKWGFSKKTIKWLCLNIRFFLVLQIVTLTPRPSSAWKRGWGVRHFVNRCDVSFPLTRTLHTARTRWQLGRWLSSPLSTRSPRLGAVEKTNGAEEFKAFQPEHERQHLHTKENLNTQMKTWKLILCSGACRNHLFMFPVHFENTAVEAKLNLAA